MTKTFDDLEDADLAEKLKAVDSPAVVDATQVTSRLVRKRRARRRHRVVFGSVVVFSSLLVGLASIRYFLAPQPSVVTEGARIASFDPLQERSDGVEIEIADVSRQLNTSAVDNELFDISGIEKTQQGKIDELKNEIELLERNRDRLRWSALRELASREIQ